MSSIHKLTWCPVCSTAHDGTVACPGVLIPIGPEQATFRTTVRTGTSIETFGVLLAPCRGLWRSRILTYPRSLWSVPGRRDTMKFVGRSPEEATGNAVTFIRRFCASRGYRTDDEIVPAPGGGAMLVTRRKRKQMPVRFHSSSRVLFVGLTHNLSAGGMFIDTGLPPASGEPIAIELRQNGHRWLMTGVVVWQRTTFEAGRPRGMGVRLIDPPSEYPEFLATLT